MADTAPSDRELDILKILWKLGEVPVRDVHQALCEHGECAFTTVQTLLRIMAGKGLVSQRAKGRTLYFKPKYTAKQAASRFLHKVFDGSIDQLVLSMLQAEKTSAEELRQLERMIGDARRKLQKP
ncbi:MAG: BlaI/MecI/CopY family transcriptional regulator [Pirellulales bacterium]